VLTEIEALGQPEQRTTTYEREARCHLVTAVSDVVDGVTRRTAFTYDGSGHVLTVTKLAVGRWTP
jgi:YD repeat-containing protein